MSKPRAVLVALVALAAFCGCARHAPAATLTAGCVAPPFNNDRPLCSAPSNPTGPRTDSLYVFMAVESVGIRDSVLAARGERVTFSWTVPGGVYLVKSWAARIHPLNGSLITGCDTTAAVAAVAPPARVLDLSP